MFVRCDWARLHSWIGRGAMVIAGILLVFGRPPASAQERPVVMDRFAFGRVVDDWKDCGLRNVNENAFVSHRSPLPKQPDTTATIRVDYGEGFTPEARTAFQRAVEIWETRIASPIPIRIEAQFEPLAENTLGGARSKFLYAVDANRNGQIDTVYGDALIDALLGEDQNPDDAGDPSPPDILASFNSSREDWYFGAGDAPSGTIDFTTVVLHEIAHGLNYFDVLTYDGGVGKYGRDWDNDGSVEERERILGIYGQHIVRKQTDGSVFALDNRTKYPTPSEALGDALTSDRLFFGGAASERGARESGGPLPPKLYAPSDFDPESSISHLDESTYGIETVNALMTPKIDDAETIRRPGPVVCGQLTDLGWTLGPGCSFGTASIMITSADPLPGPSAPGKVRLTWRLRRGETVQAFLVEHRFFGTFRQRKKVPASGPGTYSTTLSGLEVGDHTFRLSYVTSDSITVLSGGPVTVTVQARHPTISVYPNPFQDVAKVSFALPEQQRVRVEVFDVLGRHVATPFVGKRPANDARPVVFRAERFPDLGSGLYFFRVTGESFTKTVKALHVQ